MTDRNFVVKNGLQVNSVLTVEPSTGLINTSANIAIGANVVLTNQDITIGGFYANSNLVSIGNSSVNAIINSTSFSGTANTALNLSGAINLGNSTVNAIVNSSGILMSGNLSINDASISVGNSSVNLSINSSLMALGNTQVSASMVKIGNATINAVLNSSSFQISGNLSLNSTSLRVGTTTVNSSVYTGTAWSANNSQYLQGYLPSDFVTTSYLATNYLSVSGTAADSSKLGGISASSYQTTSGLSGNVSKLTSNNSNYFSGYLPSVFLKKSEYLSNNMIDTSIRYYFGGITVTGDLVAYAFSVSTTIIASGNIQGSTIIGTSDVIVSTSDARLKKNLTPIANALAMIDNINGYRYQLRDDIPELPRNDRWQVGLLVQDVEPILPEIIHPAPFDTASDGTSKSGMDYKTISYEKMVPFLVEAIKDLKKEVMSLKEKIK